MQIERRLIVFQLIMSLSFLILPINYIFKHILENNLINYIGLGVFVVLIITSLFSLKLSKRLVAVNKNALNVNKYITYFYIISYIFLILQGNNEVVNIKDYVLLSFVIVASLTGFIYNLILLLKTK